ncbi:MAG TPA: hypothetical protein IGS53_15280 [Leptolyngbyaceae cyanobacterium M33_DOE_097]|nr:hypothetical protein [Leptolyngbyaceae cyanobacterium M33_DOE_097]
MPKSPEHRNARVAQIGTDGFYLLDCLYADSTPAHGDRCLRLKPCGR